MDQRTQQLVHQQTNEPQSEAVSIDLSKDEAESEDDSVPLYELHWALNTTAHGFNRIFGEGRIFQRFIWTVAVLVCFGVVIWEVQKSVVTYLRFDTSTEINKTNVPEIEFPSVTFCNFNRWRRSKLTDEVLEQLKEVLSLYSYDYVINDLDELEPEALLSNLLPTTPLTTTTTVPPIRCILPNATAQYKYEVIGSDTMNIQTVEVGAAIEYQCTDSNKLPMDGDVIMTCTKQGSFSGRLPLCVNVGDRGERYTVNNSLSDPAAMVASVETDVTDLAISEVTLCFWLFVNESNTLGTILSYGEGGESLLSISSREQRQPPGTYGVNYKLFGVEGSSFTLTAFGQWHPFCFTYSQAEAKAQFYKFVESNFSMYEENLVANRENARPFPAQGQMVLFNDYSNYLLLKDDISFKMPSAGGSITNVNMWTRVLPLEVMNAMMWEGDMLSMTPSTFPSLFGNIFNYTRIYDAADFTSGKSSNQLAARRLRRQIPKERVRVTQATTTTKSPEDTLKKVFDYAAFTRAAGWQLVDNHSNHSEAEPYTLLECTYRGVQCDSRWFEKKLGAYGNCYTFNQNIPKSLAEENNFRIPLIQDNAGPMGGLNLLMDIQQWEYAESAALNGNPELGIKFIVHAPYESPVINNMGYVVGPGSKAYVGFDKTTIHNIREPWGRCDPDRQLKYSESYTFDGCVLECKLNRVIEMCNCRPYYFPGDAAVCKFADLRDCAFIEIAKVNADVSQCGCPIACDAQQYNVKLSYVNFPNDQFGRDLSNNLNIRLPKLEAGVPIYSSKLQYIKSNLVSIDLYFESLLVTEVQQNKAMDFTALLSNVGGQLGLFIGCSFLTFFEVFECIFMSAWFHCKRFRRHRNRKEYRPNMEPQKQAAVNYQYEISMSRNSKSRNNNSHSFDRVPSPPVA